MPAVFAESVLIHGGRRVRAKVLLNTGGIDAELVIPRRLADRLEVKTAGKARIDFGGKSHSAGTGLIEVVLKERGKERRAVLESIVLPDEVLDRPLLGVTGLEKLRIIPDVITGKVVFK